MVCSDYVTRVAPSLHRRLRLLEKKQSDFPWQYVKCLTRSISLPSDLPEGSSKGIEQASLGLHVGDGGLGEVEVELDCVFYDLSRRLFCRRCICTSVSENYKE